MKYRAFHKISYGLYIIASRINGENAGYVGNTAFQVTSSPPRIAISCNKKNRSTEIIIQSGSFSLSVLKKSADSKLIGTFGFMSGTETDKFRDVTIKTAKTGAPIVLDSINAWFDCKVVSTLDVGTHILIIGEVVDSEVISEEDPLTYDYYREKFRMLSPKNSPTYIEKEKLAAEEVPLLHPSEDKEKKNAEEKENSLQNEPSVYTCTICGYRYNPEDGDPTIGIPAGTPFEDLPDDYKCPVCNAAKEYFRKE